MRWQSSIIQKTVKQEERTERMKGNRENKHEHDHHDEDGVTAGHGA